MLVESGAATSSRSVVTYRFHGSLGVPPSEKTIKLLFWGSATYLETKASLQPLGGYVLLTNQMDRYSFKLAGDSLGGVPRTMEVVEIGSGSITIRFWPDNREVRLPLGKAVYVDIAHNSNADVILTLEQLNSDGNALIRVQFPDQDYLAGSAGERRNSLIAIAVTGSIVAGLVYVYLNSWLLKSRGLPPKDWWFVHHHEPF